MFSLILPNGLEVQIDCPLTTTDTPSLSTGVSASSAEAKTDTSVAREIQAAPSSRLVVVALLLGFCCCTLLGGTVGLDSLPLQIRIIFDCFER